MDLSEYSPSELKNLIKKSKKQLIKKQNVALTSKDPTVIELSESIREQSKSLRITPAELLALVAKGLRVKASFDRKKRKKALVKFRDQNGNEWCGFGRKPLWLNGVDDISQFRV